MATFDPESNKLTVTLLLRKDKEFDPQILKLSNGAEDFVYSLAVNEVPTTLPPVVTEIQGTVEHTDVSFPNLPEVTPETASTLHTFEPEKPREAPVIQEASNTPVDTPEASGEAVSDTEGQQGQGSSGQFVKMPENVVQVVMPENGNPDA